MLYDSDANRSSPADVGVDLIGIFAYGVSRLIPIFGGSGLVNFAIYILFGMDIAVNFGSSTILLVYKKVGNARVTSSVSKWA